MIKHRNRLKSTTTPTRYAEHLSEVFPTTLSDITSMMRHPRSLARPIATWRPPSTPLPPLPGHDPLSVALSRHRVGPAARSIIRDTGIERDPAYLVTARITDPDGYRVPSALAEGWIRALLADHDITSVHELTDEPTSTFCWLVDAHFIPLPSPAFLFQDASRAA